MPVDAQNPLILFSEAMSESARLARPLVAGITIQGHRTRSGTVWRKDIVVASEQAFPDVAEARVSLADGRNLAAQVAGRDPGTNVIALRVDGTPDPAPLTAAEPQPGALALAFGADQTGIAVRLG